MARRSNTGIDITTFRPTIQKIVADLDLHDQKIAYRMRSAVTFGGRVWHGHMVNGKWYDALIIINNRTSRKAMQFNIAHELRHVYQRKTGMLEDRYNVTRGWVRFWNGAEVCTTKHEDMLFSRDEKAYRALPWEIDANDYAERMTGFSYEEC